MNIQRLVDGSTTTILKLEGKIDAVAASKLQSEILSVLQSSKRLILDLEKVPFVCNAGLRAILIGHKTAMAKRGTMELRNVSPTLMATLKSIGLAELVKIT